MSELFHAVAKCRKNDKTDVVLRLLAKGGADVNYKSGYDGWTSLIHYANSGHTKMVNTIILSGADLHAATNDGRTAARCALNQNHHDLAAFLDRLAAPQTIITLSSPPQPPLHVPLTVYFFFAGLPLQPNPQPAYHTIVHHEGLWLAVIVPWLQDVALPLYATQPKVKAFVDTMLQNVLAMHSVSDGTVQFLVATFPDAVEAMTKEFVHKTLLNAVANIRSDVVVQFLIATFPDAVKATTEVTTDCHDQPTGGDTVLHLLAAAKCSTTAECRHASTLCFLLVQRGAALAAINAKGQTPAETASKGMLENPQWDTSGPLNHHLIATLREVAQFKRKKHSHLSLMHLRDWTTVSHAWSTPSAKFVALTVLLAGETYKRGLLPRLPMDCWYKILNCIPRHQLRLGECDPEAEQGMMAKYVAILSEARTAMGSA